jgi:hypothetical protein
MDRQVKTAGVGQVLHARDDAKAKAAADESKPKALTRTP